MKVSQAVEEYCLYRPTMILDPATILRCFVESVKEYQAWGGIDGVSEIVDADTELSASVWGVISPLAHLLCELENALIQEASRVVSHEPYGRTSSEIEQDVQNFRQDHFRKWAFHQEIITI